MRPRGKLPKLFSRNRNSTVFKAAWTVAGSIPSRTSAERVSVTSASTRSASAVSTPLRPVEKNDWRNSFSRPVPARSSPSPESIRALRKGEPGMPSRMYSSTWKEKFIFASADSDRSQFTVTMPFGCADSGPPRPESKGRVIRLGLSSFGCSGTSDPGGFFSKSLRYSCTISSRFSGSSSP